MFYYLILNSSILKKKKEKDKIVLTLIGGSLIYLVMHAFLSYSFKKDIVKYIWFLFLIDISAVFISSDFQGFSSIQISNNSIPIKRIYEEPDVDLTVKNTKFNANTTNLRDEDNEKPTTPHKKMKKILKKKNNLDRINNNSLKEKKSKKKQVKFEESTPIQDLNTSKEDTYNLEEAQNINLTLESLENLNLELNYPDENSKGENENQDTYQIRGRPKKKMEDEYSDIGSELDLEKFENAVANS